VEAAVRFTLVNLVVALDLHLGFRIGAVGMDDGPGAALTSPTMTHIHSFRLTRSEPQWHWGVLSIVSPSPSLFLVSGTDDQMWPSSELADIALHRLEAHRHPFPFKHIKCPEAGHLILVPYWPTTVRAVGLRVEELSGYLYSQGGTSKADADAGIDAWTNTLAFLKNAVDAYG
jgi:hypothetical protein